MVEVRQPLLPEAKDEALSQSPQLQPQTRNVAEMLDTLVASDGTGAHRHVRSGALSNGQVALLAASNVIGRRAGASRQGQRELSEDVTDTAMHMLAWLERHAPEPIRSTSTERES